MAKKAASRALDHSLTLESADWDLMRLHRLLDELLRVNVLVVGDVGIDRYTVGTVERISPEAPVPVVSVTQEIHKLGLAANVADNVHALGGSAHLVGVIGKDRGADDLRALLHVEGLSDRGLVTDASRRTILKERVVSDRQQLVRIDYETLSPLDRRTQSALIARMRLAAKKSHAIVLEDYAKGLLTRALCSDAVKVARARKVPIIVDPNSKSELALYRGVDGLTPNSKEAEALTGIPIKDPESLLKVGRALLEGAQAKWAVVTLGKDGMALFERNQLGMVLIPTTAREVYDVSGAGDTVIAVLSMALARGATLEEACVLGNLAAGVEVGKRGTATVSIAEVRAALEYSTQAR